VPLGFVLPLLSVLQLLFRPGAILWVSAAKTYFGSLKLSFSLEFLKRLVPDFFHGGEVVVHLFELPRLLPVEEGKESKFRAGIKKIKELRGAMNGCAMRGYLFSSPHTHTHTHTHTSPLSCFLTPDIFLRLLGLELLKLCLQLELFCSLLSAAAASLYQVNVISLVVGEDAKEGS